MGGNTATMVLGKSYSYMLDQAVGTRVERDLLRVRKKEDFKTFFDCGSCEGRQVEWTIRVTPEAVEDLGDKSMVPELDAVDELVYRIRKGLPTQGLATRRIVQTLKRAMEEEDEESRSVHESSSAWKNEASSPGSEQESSAKQDDDDNYRGMLLETPKVFRAGKRTKLCFSCDGIGTFLFTFERSRGKLRMVDIEDWDEEHRPGACARPAQN